MLIQNVNNAVQSSPSARGSSDSAAVADSSSVQAAAPQVVAAPAADKPVPAAQLQTAVQNANQAMQASNRDLAFSVDTDTKQTVVKLMDTKTGDVIGQFPTHQMLEISKAVGLMQEQLQQATISKAPVQSTPGMLIKQQA
jgi:flagellar protein FlaG